jgi:ATP-dependent DNA helicase PIF1
LSRPPNAPREIELIRAWVDNPNREENHPDGESTDVINWPTIGSSPINEYNTEGLFDMAFPTLFPKGEVDWLQPQMRNVHLHEYAKHLLRYRDNSLGGTLDLDTFYLISS